MLIPKEGMRKIVYLKTNDSILTNSNLIVPNNFSFNGFHKFCEQKEYLNSFEFSRFNNKYMIEGNDNISLIDIQTILYQYTALEFKYSYIPGYNFNNKRN